MRIRKTWLVILLTVFMVMGTLPTVLFADDVSPSAINLVQNSNASHIEGAQKCSIWFGNYKQSSDGSGDHNKEPIKWRVLQNADGKLFLLSDVAMDFKPFNDGGGLTTWEECTLRAWLNGNDPDGFINSAFDAGEQATIVETNLVNETLEFSSGYGGSSGNDTVDKVFVLSVGDVMNTDYGFSDNNVEVATRVAPSTSYAISKTIYEEYGPGNCYWWLRQMGLSNRRATNVTPSGTIDFGGLKTGSSIVFVRPAFNLDLSTVLFTSAVDVGKISGEVGPDALTQVGTDTSDEWKLTLKDEAHDGFAVEKAIKKDGSVEITYSGAVTGNDEYISAVITDKPVTEAGATIKYYGRIKECAATDDAAGTITINTTDKLGETDRLYVFSEQFTGAEINYGGVLQRYDRQTDYAGSLQEVAATAEFTITLDLNGGELDGKKGTVTFTCEEGTDFTLPAPTKEGYVFDYWEGSRFEAGEKYPVTENHTFTAQWKEDSAGTDDPDEPGAEGQDSGTDTAAAPGKVVKKPANNVKTGDEANLLLGLLLMGVSLAGIAGGARMRRRDNE